MGVSNFLYHSDKPDGFSAPCVLEIEDMQKAINTDANGNAKAIRACYGQCGYDSVFRGTGQGITGVMEEVEPKIVGYSRSSEGSGKIVGRHLNDYANTITCSTGSGNATDMYVAEPRIMQLVGDRGNPSVSVKDIAFTVCSSPMSDRGQVVVEPKIAASRGRGDGWKQQLEINESGTSNTITSVLKDNYVMEQDLRMEDGCLVDKEGKRYRIRKLTPRECFRLMDVKDKDIDKIQQAGIAKTNQYKLAGNSIVVSPMYHIFRKLFVQKENENQQLELF